MPLTDLLIISDLHMHGQKPGPKAPSFLSNLPSQSSPLLNPLAGIPNLLQQENLRPSWILCPGDMADKADERSLHDAWDALLKIRKATGAGKIACTVGNHDIESRRSDPNNLPNSTLLALSPKFPGLPARDCRIFWTKSYVSVVDRNRDLHLLVLNSSAFHGVASKGSANEFERGKIAENVLDELATLLPGRCQQLNLILVHHHLRPHPWLTDGSHIVGGARLEALLMSTGHQWLVVHGHRHLPDLSYCSGGALAPVVLSAGSVAASPYPVNGRIARNQIHYIRLDSDNQPQGGIVGTVRSWDWAPHSGWERAFPTSGLPYRCGFGFRGNIGIVADNIVAALQQSNTHQENWTNLVAQQPDIEFLTPDDKTLLMKALEQRSIEILYDKVGTPLAARV